LKDLLLRLLQLQAIDTKVKELEATKKSLPARLEPARRDLARLEAMLAGEKQRLAETETWKKQQGQLLEREQDALKSAKSKLQSSKTGKEYNAASREVDNKRKAISDRETELKKLGETFGETASQVSAHDRDVDEIKKHLADDEAGVASRLEAIEAEIATTTSGRAELRAAIEPSWLKTYDSLCTKRGYAVAPVVKGICRGCHMQIPPQLNNTLARLERLEVCPRCGRIIYRSELLDPPADAAGEADAAK